MLKMENRAQSKYRYSGYESTSKSAIAHGA